MYLSTQESQQYCFVISTSIWKVIQSLFCNSEEELLKKPVGPVGCLSVDCLPPNSQLPTNSWPTVLIRSVGQQLADCWWPVSEVSVSCWLKLLVNITLFIHKSELKRYTVHCMGNFSMYSCYKNQSYWEHHQEQPNCYSEGKQSHLKASMSEPAKKTTLLLKRSLIHTWHTIRATRDYWLIRLWSSAARLRSFQSSFPLGFLRFGLNHL